MLWRGTVAGLTLYSFVLGNLRINAVKPDIRSSSRSQNCESREQIFSTVTVLRKELRWVYKQGFIF